MAKFCNITVYFVDGSIEEYYGGLHADEKLLRIYPADGGTTINIPMVSIQKYITAN